MGKRRSEMRAHRVAAVVSALLALPAAAVDLPPGFELRVAPISGPLGLVDVALCAPEVDRALIVLPGDGGDGVRRKVRVPMRRETPYGSRPSAALFSARVMSAADGQGTVTFSIAVSGRALKTDQVLGPFVQSADPGPGRTTPDWAKGAVWYQIFPERFRNGNATNDPRAPEFTRKGWTSDWYGFDADELEAARARVTVEPPHVLRAVADPRSAAIQARRYGGDLEGVVEKLDELRDLGVTAIYLNPVFAAHSHHKYDATDYRHIDPSFAGSGDGEADAAALRGETEDPSTWVWTEADRYVLNTLLPEVHGRGMRIVFDGVWNHVGTRFWAFADVMRRGRDSKYAEWFQVEFADAERLADPRVRELDVREGSLIAWKSWNGVNGSLPVFARSANGRLHPEVERHVFEVTRRWMSPGDGKRGIDGWRLDVVPDVPRPFWEAWCAHAREINSDCVLLAEMWFDAREYFSSTERSAVFDGQMNYPVAMPLVRWLADGHYTSTQLGGQLGRVLDRPAQHELVQMNLLGSHDTARVATMIEAGVREYGGQISQRVQRVRPSAESYDKVALGVAVLACWPGSPMVYYGDEYGMHGGNDPHCRKPVPWADAGEMERAGDRAEAGLREKFRAWLRLRQDPEIGEVLRYGDVRIIATGNKDVFAFERGLNGKRVVFVANRDDTVFDASVLIEAAAERCGVPRLHRVGNADGAERAQPGSTIAARTATIFATTKPE